VHGVLAADAVRLPDSKDTSLEHGRAALGGETENEVAHGAVVRWNDVEIDAGADAVATRRAMEERFGGVARP
jgi:hypothetical protein